METKEKEKITYTKEMLVKEIASECRRDSRTVRAIYNSLEENVFDILSSADSDTDASIRLFEGISLNSTYVPEKTKVNNLTGETITTSSKIKPKANITRSYCEKLTNHSESY